MSVGSALPAAQRAADLSSLRVLVVHEWLYAWAGAERCLEQIITVFPQADLLVGIVTPKMREHNKITRRARETWAGRFPGARTHHRWLLPLHAAAFALHDTRGYDLVISASHAFEKFVRASAGATHICYCFSPPRFVWDMQQTYAARASLPDRVMLSIAAPAFRALDRYAARRVDRFVSISKYIGRRIERCYGVPSDVVYPPVSARALSPAVLAERPTEPFLLYLGRLVEYKRVDLLVRMAGRIQLKLVIAGDGPERASLERLAGPYVEFRGEVSEAEASRLLTTCTAFVFAGEEDFGIALVEANAHGKPVVCFNRGGATETMIPNETAVMFESQSEADLCAAVQDCLARSWDPSTLRRNAQRFSAERFRDDFRSVVARALA